MSDYDFIIIGTGAGGGTLAYHLAPSGKKILILERGDFLPREQENWSPQAVFVEARYQARETWLDKHGKEFHPGIHYFVGGNTKFYGAALLRLRKEDFGAIHYPDGISPAWPLGYEDFEPYYTKAERLYHVHGKHGADPTEPFVSADYAYPPVSHEPRIQELCDDLVKGGLHPFPLPLGILLDEENGKPARKSPCIRCSAFDGFPCPLNAKADAHIMAVEPALDHSNVTLLTNTLVTRLETSASGREVARVHAVRNGEPMSFSGSIVVVACGAINSAALLLKSACEKHPGGLANGSGVVGRHYMRHNNSAFMAISKTPNPTRFQKTLALSDFYFHAADWDYPLGFIQMLGKSDGAMLRGEAPDWAGLFVNLTPEKALDEMAAHSVDFWLTTEDLPMWENQVTLDSKGQITLSLTDTNLDAHARLAAKLKSILVNIGFRDSLFPRTLFLGKRIPIAGTAHQCGTVRFGNDPKTSSLDANCKAHELDNLYVVDGSFMVSAGAVNPALTIAANALRVGDHLLGGI